MIRSRLDDQDLLAANIMRSRPPRLRDPAAESRALDALIGRINMIPGRALQALAETVAELCRAGSAGVSLLEGGRFVWPAIAGAWAPFVAQGMPRDASPCGVVIDRGTALLFNRPELIFPDVDMQPAIREILLVPVYIDAVPRGTLWAISHDDQCFDAEDVRILDRLALVATAIERTRRLAAEKRAIVIGTRERLRNTVAVIRSLVRTGTTGLDDDPSPIVRLGSRLEAYAHGIGRHGGGDGDLWQMLAHHLGRHGERPGRRVTLDGPQVAIPDRATGILSLALHEVMENAFQHGALAHAGGMVRVRWTVTDAGDGRLLDLCWSERAAAVPGQGGIEPGFGLELITHGLPDMIGATTRVDLPPAGISIAIRLAVDSPA